MECLPDMWCKIRVVKDEFDFRPPVQQGLIAHAVVILILAAAASWGIWQASQADIGPVFLFFLLPAILAVSLIPTLIYRAYALRKARYILERDGIHLVWGLRAEDIPITDVLWVHPAEELDQSPRKPWLTVPGAILGSRRLPDGGQIEYMASSPSKLVYIATRDRIYAVSPDDREDFIRTFQRFLELGSLRPIAARSVHPSFLLARVWALKPLRYLILAGLVLSLALLIWVSLVIPSRGQVFLGFNSAGLPRDPIPTVRLLLLPVINGFFFGLDFLLGLYFFRRGENQTQSGDPQSGLAYLLAFLFWGASLITPGLFLVSVFFILRVG
jgi:hypothetical protein